MCVRGKVLNAARRGRPLRPTQPLFKSTIYHTYQALQFCICHVTCRYCGETSLLQTGLALGQWTSQFNVRAVASPFKSEQAQSGASEGRLDFFSQLLLDDMAPISTKKGNSWGKAAQYLHLNATPYNSAAQKPGLEVRYIYCYSYTCYLEQSLLRQLAG